MQPTTLRVPSATADRTAAAPAPTCRARPSHLGLVRAIEYLRARAAAPVTLAELARVACLSKYHFLRTFTREYGSSPHAYQMQLRLALARALVDAGEPLSSVAYSAGFADQSHLTRRFKQAFGETPGAYARRAKLVRAA
jgi:transcriptional regulator GlxA family with amidase domain